MDGEPSMLRLRVTMSHQRLWPLLFLFPLLGLFPPAEAAERGAALAFYAIGGPEWKQIQSTLYRVDTATKQVLASVKLPKVVLFDLALSADGRQLFALGEWDTVIILDADRLSLQAQFSLYKQHPQTHALFAHPKSGLLYLAVGGGKSPKEIRIVDPRAHKVAKMLKLESIITRGFIYDPSRDRLYVTAAPPAIINPSVQRITGYIKLPSLDTIFWLLLGKAGRQLFLSDGGSNLYVYDVDQARVSRRATLSGLRTFRDPALSHDGARIFAATSPYPDPGTAVVLDTNTLTILHTLTFSDTVKHFVPAPDGQGMWMVTVGGEVYRLDDQTGQVLEPVPLPFRLGKLLTPP